MNVRTYTAPSMAEALAQVKRDLGAHAVVLHTRNTKRGGVMGLGARTVVEVMAADGRQVGRAKAARRREATPARREPAPAPASASSGDLIKRTYAAAMAEIERKQAESAPVAVHGPAEPAPVAVPPDRLSDEMAEVKRMVARVMLRQAKDAPAPVPELPDGLFDYYRELIEQEITEELADEVMQHANGMLSDADRGCGDACRGAVSAALADLLPVDEHAGDLPPTDDGRARTLALIGPTGVGKTTTVAKLAATFKLKHNKHVGLITLDTYRIAAVEQLKTYAQIIGLPLHIVGSPDELGRAIKLCAGCDAVLIDTAGRSQRNGDRLDELSAFMRVARPHETHLVLSATASRRVLEDIADQFGRVQPDRLIFTKLDEAVTFGPLLTVARRLNKPISYVTTGQEVPHQIEAAHSARLAALMLGKPLDAHAAHYADVSETRKTAREVLGA